MCAELLPLICNSGCSQSTNPIASPQKVEENGRTMKLRLAWYAMLLCFSTFAAWSRSSCTITSAVLFQVIRESETCFLSKCAVWGSWFCYEMWLWLWLDCEFDTMNEWSWCECDCECDHEVSCFCSWWSSPSGGLSRRLEFGGFLIFRVSSTKI